MRRVALRKAGIETPILVFGGFSPEDAPLFIDYDLEATVFEPRAVALLKRAALQRNRPARVHVKLETGMGRLGRGLARSGRIYRNHCP